MSKKVIKCQKISLKIICQNLSVENQKLSKKRVQRSKKVKSFKMTFYDISKICEATLNHWKSPHEGYFLDHSYRVLYDADSFKLRAYWSKQQIVF